MTVLWVAEEIVQALLVFQEVANSGVGVELRSDVLIAQDDPLSLEASEEAGPGAGWV